MPRTKRPVRKQEKIAEDDDALKKLNKLVIDQKNKIDSRAHMELRNVELAFKILLGSISNTYLQKTVGQLKTELHLKEPVTGRSTTRNSSRAASHDDGYLTENSSQGSGERAAKKTYLAPPSASRSASRRSRSADASLRSARAAPRTQRRRSRSVYRTPAYSKNAAVTYPVITPKVTPHTPLTVLRQPRAGEMVLSMSGSPVMATSVCTMQSDERANCNIMLQDGTMLSLQPKQLRQSQAYIPFSLMDSNVLHQLKTLKDNLDKVVKLGEKAIK
ncbi:borealin [Nymphalis io]|uniref:borealin n=1 Tax=Inachis io TaxID=171585 RepID=UPI002166CC81|nr:borealin [Nymphalis io]